MNLTFPGNPAGFPKFNSHSGIHPLLPLAKSHHRLAADENKQHYKGNQVLFTHLYGGLTRFYGGVSNFYGALSHLYVLLSHLYIARSHFYKGVSNLYGEVSRFSGAFTHLYAPPANLFRGVTHLYGEVSHLYGALARFHEEISNLYGAHLRRKGRQETRDFPHTEKSPAEIQTDRMLNPKVAHQGAGIPEGKFPEGKLPAQRKSPGIVRNRV